VIVFVTGASSGFGAAIARLFAATGAEVIAAARRTDRIPTDPGIQPLELDVRDPTAVADALTGRRIGVLVNNAGLAKGLEPAHRADLADWDQMLDTNCRGLVHCTRAALPGMVERGRGHIVNIGSIAGTYPYPGSNTYGATKAFVHQFSLNLRADLHGTGVRVTCVEPGMCEGTEFSVVRFAGDTDRAADVYAGLQALTADDIAATVHWVTTQPPHVNVNTVELMPVAQSFGPLPAHRTTPVNER
jgi:3-hydroxy acid dehydrogenase/malonic semialdehyde reductase